MYYRIAILDYPKEPLTYCAQKKLERGDVVSIELRGKERFGVVLQEVKEPEYRCLEAKEHNKKISEKQLQIAQFIASYYFASIGESLALFEPYERDKKEFTKVAIETSIQLSTQQKEAYDFIENHPFSLLFGDTGSGKTEIYIKQIEKILNAQKSAIFLMPEISLTPQTEKRLKKEFGDLVAIWHSKIQKKRKREIIEQIHRGEIRIVAGARSALFLPLRELGLIVVDEEHDDAYKSQSRPRYNAKDLALYFGKVYNIQVILGSATPSLQSYNKIPRFRLKGRYFKSEKSIFFEESSELLSSFIIKKIEKNLRNRNQSIIFLPTRGNFKYQICKECGETIECPYCSVSMSLHRNINALKCHYCGFTQKIALKCHNCGGEEFLNSREGTAEIVQKLEILFPDAKIGKFDRDSVTTDGKLKKILKEFNEGKTDILVGTQMLSKGHDYHNVSLVVVLGIDYLLKSADFRARERAISLLHQISGRSGRREHGEVVIQTINGEFFKEYMSDYEDFLKEEEEYRKGLYPPFMRLALLIFSDKNEKKAQESMEQAREHLLESGVQIIGSQKAPIYKISQKFRFYILLRSESPKALLNAISGIKREVCEVDIDPINFS